MLQIYIMRASAYNTKLYLNFILSSTGKQRDDVTERAPEHETEVKPESLRNPYVNSINRNMDTKDQA